ncbi:MAG TPA: hypothetical protein VNM37_28485 [Candidatus Dormibacteraeota bacterium]|nr:hypothetical protein [Candidatus Dormibacteraeota bacterium]
MKPEDNFDTMYRACKQFGFGDKLTAEQCWNAGYQLGRRRWHWGPAWMVSVHGWVNTQIDRFKSIFRKRETLP